MVIRRRRTKRRYSVSFIFIRKYGKRKMPIDMLKRQCCDRLQQKIVEAIRMFNKVVCKTAA